MFLRTVSTLAKGKAEKSLRNVSMVNRVEDSYKT